MSKDLTHEVCQTLNSQINYSSAKPPTRNNTAQKAKSLHRPTPVKNHKIVKDVDSEEDVISEMRSLTVRPTNRDQDKSFNTTYNTARMRSKGLEIENEVQVSNVSKKAKRKLLRWLEEINLIRKKAVSLQEFPQFCRNGVIFFDLINKLNGRNPVLKGVQRNPKNITCITANFAKVLGYLRKYPKMNARYLWAENMMMDGNNEVIWGFLDDVWYWKNNKISPYDSSKNNGDGHGSVDKSAYDNSSVCSIDERSPVRMKHQFSSEIASNPGDRISPENSPDRNRFMMIQDDKEAFHRVDNRDNVTEINLPNTRDQFTIVGTGTNNSPIRGSYSAKRLRRKTLITGHKMQNSHKKPARMTQRGYSASKLSVKNQYMLSNSKQSPTFRPNYQSSTKSRRTGNAQKPPRKKKTNKAIIGKTQEGRSIYSNFTDNNITIDFIDDKPKNYQRKRISAEDEQKTRSWLRKINFHSYITEDQLDLMQDPMRNGIML